LPLLPDPEEEVPAPENTFFQSDFWFPEPFVATFAFGGGHPRSMCMGIAETGILA
jgi:hypothetical protein